MSRLVIPSIVAVGGLGIGKTQTLLSITTAPSGSFTKGSQYYNDTDKKIYTAVEDNTWTDAKISDPLFGVYYQYNGHTYVWDGNSLEYFELEDYQKTADKKSTIDSGTINNQYYPTTQAVANYVAAQGIAKNFDDVGITKTTYSYTFLDLAQEIQSKGLANGTTLYGEVRNQGLPSGIVNSELRVEVLETKGNGNQVLQFTLYSTNVEPHEWTWIFYQNNPVDWVLKPVITQLDYLQSSAPSSFVADNKWLNTTSNQLFTALTDSTWNSGYSISENQIFSFNDLLYRYNGTSLEVYSAETIIDQNSQNKIKVWYGTQNEYDALNSYDANTDYKIVDNSQTLSTLLATQQEFDSSAQNKAATAYQVQQALASIPSGGAPTIIWYDSTSFVGDTITIPDTSSASLVKVYYNGLLQQADTNGQTNDYSINGTTLTLNKTLSGNDKVAVEIF